MMGFQKWCIECDIDYKKADVGKFCPVCEKMLVNKEFFQ